MEKEKDIIVGNDLGRKRVSFVVGIDGDESTVTLPTGVWNYGAIVSALVRTKYSEDDVEAIVNNNLALMAMPSAASAEEGEDKLAELRAMQAWREKCKARAKELLAALPQF